MYSHGILVVLFVVLLAKCLQWLTNARTPYALVHIIAAHTAFDYKLVTWVAVVLGPSAMFNFVDFTALFYGEAKWPFSTSALVSHAKTRAAHLFVLYGYYNNNFIFSCMDRLEYIN